MRAARALEMLLILQRRGRTPARELANLLEVSERTILRDVEVLSEAGVPIFASRGVHGGIELLDGFQTNLTGLTSDEAQVLFLVGQPDMAHRLGLGAPTQAVRAKLLGALSPALADEAATLSDWFIHDPDPWAGSHIPHGELRRLATCIRRRRHVEMTIAGQPKMTVRPGGLILKAGSWFLVCFGPETVEVRRIDDLRATRITRRPFTPPAGFDLRAFWTDYAASER